MTSESPRKPEVSDTSASLDEKGQALMALLKELLREFEPEVGSSLDEVVVTVQPDQVAEVCRTLKDDTDAAFDLLQCLSVVDYEDRFELVYQLYSIARNHHFALKASVTPEDPRLPSVISVWRGADWFEREGHDLFGIVFEGHPNLAPLLLYEEFEGYPGRKSYPFNDYREW